MLKPEAHAAAEQGLLTTRTRRPVCDRHVETQRPGEVVCLDAFSIGTLKGVAKLWQMTACDAASSFAVATIVPRVTSAQAVRFLTKHLRPVYQDAGHRLRAVLTDGGVAWKAGFACTCRALGIEHRRTKPRHAWTNGFVERLQGTILTELWRVAFWRTSYTACRPVARDLQGFLRFYNHEQPHQCYRLKGRTPAAVFYRHRTH